jgi:indolepyruvate ferredoxin oxidoreductase beta subunit
MVRQSEVHGMAQRGGAVLAHLRISDETIVSDLVPRGCADIIIAMEPLESLRYIEWLAPSGVLVSAAEPLVNIPNYPETADILAAVRSLPRSRLIEAVTLAKEAGLPRAINTVMVGAASLFLPLEVQTMENTIAAMFSMKEPSIAVANTNAFRLGRKAAAETSETSSHGGNA